jgi:signal peptidase I
MEWILTLGAAALIALCIRTFIFEPVMVDGHSMDDTLADHEIMFINKMEYSSAWLFGNKFTFFGNPKRFDVVICRYPGRGNTNFVKRVVGLPGDTVSVQDGYLYINDEKYDEPYINDDYRSGYLNNFAPFTVPDGQYFVMGDHRNNSNDSRSIGPIDRNMIVGHVVQVVFPFSSFRSIPNGLNVKAQ